MGRFDGILICSDIDGTFAQGKSVPQRNLDAVNYFQSEGGIFTLATGRYAGYADFLPVKVNGPMITENGARIYDAELGRTLWTFPLDSSGILLEWVDQKKIPLVTLRFFDGPLVIRCGEVVNTVLSHVTGDLLQIICHGFEDEETALAFRNEARTVFGSRYDIRRSWDKGVEFISPLGGKGNCLKHLKTILGEKVHTAIAIGDFENDLSMLQAADRSFAPSNACDGVLRLADTVLCDYKEGAVGALIELLDREYEGGILK